MQEPRDSAGPGGVEDIGEFDRTRADRAVAFLGPQSDGAISSARVSCAVSKSAPSLEEIDPIAVLPGLSLAGRIRGKALLVELCHAVALAIGRGTFAQYILSERRSAPGRHGSIGYG
jgi:hypothetical protein